MPPTSPSSAGGLGPSPAAPADDLLGFVASVAGEGGLRVEESLGHGFVRLRVAEAERRQAKHDIRRVEDIVVETLRNARDAGARHVYLASSREGDTRTLTVLDDGCGVPDDMRERIFDARVTSKLESMCVDQWGVHGRGMALYSIRQNVPSARVVASGEGLGTSLRVEADCSSLPERADQSTLPALERDEGGTERLGPGPRNIARAALEFALSCAGRVEVFLGSPAEVVATLYERDPAGIPLRDLLFSLSEGRVPVCSRLRAAADAEDLARRAAGVGLLVSARTAQRVLSGEVAPLRPALSRLCGAARKGAEAPRPVDLERDRRGLRLSSDDAALLLDDLRGAFRQVEEKYYVSLAGEPRVRVAHDRVVVTFPIRKE